MNKENRITDLLLEAEKELQELQIKNADRNRAVALTHIQTALLWLNKQYIDEVLKFEQTKDN